MSYDVQFVGLAWFHEFEPGTVRVLMPDGRNIDQVPPHLFSISVRPDSLVPNQPPTGWGDGEIETDQFQTQFWVSPSKIVLGGADMPGSVDMSHQIERLPSLRAINPNAKVNPDKAKKVGDLAIRQGTFTVFRHPNKAPKLAALVSRLTVPHDGSITITLTSLPDPQHAAASDPPPVASVSPSCACCHETVESDAAPNVRDEPPAIRTITLKPGTEIAFVNASRGAEIPIGGPSHDIIYSQLCETIVALIMPPIQAAHLLPVPSEHPAFVAPNAAINGPGCSNARA